MDKKKLTLPAYDDGTCKEYQREIKRLRAVNHELLEALKKAKERTAQYGPFKAQFNMIALIAAKAIEQAETEDER